VDEWALTFQQRAARPRFSPRFLIHRPGLVFATHKILVKARSASTKHPLQHCVMFTEAIISAPKQCRRRVYHESKCQTSKCQRFHQRRQETVAEGVADSVLLRRAQNKTLKPSKKISQNFASKLCENEKEAARRRTYDWPEFRAW